MSHITQAPEKTENLPFALLTFPFATIEAIGGRILTAFTSKSKQQTKEPQPAKAGNRIPDITTNQQYMIADRTYSAEVRGRKVSFYQYHEANVIRIICRELRHLKPIDFTPAIAEEAAVVYDIDGAIQWVRQNGLESEVVKRTAAKVQPPSGKAAAPTHTAPREIEGRQENSKPATPGASSAALNIVPATGNKSAPFTGRIVSFGTSKRTGNGDGKPYITYAMKIRSETGAYDKEFIGEHLSDLVADMKLQVGQLIHIQLLGKHYFEVEVGGKMEQRNRNHFAINII